MALTRTSLAQHVQAWTSQCCGCTVYQQALQPATVTSALYSTCCTGRDTVVLVHIMAMWTAGPDASWIRRRQLRFACLVSKMHKQCGVLKNNVLRQVP